MVWFMSVDDGLSGDVVCLSKLTPWSLFGNNKVPYRKGTRRGVTCHQLASVRARARVTPHVWQGGQTPEVSSKLR